MGKIAVSCKFLDGNIYKITIANESIKCPYCGVPMIPKYIFAYQKNGDTFDVFCNCVNHKCNATFISIFTQSNGFISSFKEIIPMPPYEKKQFNEIISKISPSFIEIYNQAFQAEQMKLSHICGMGYRKSLEFLIKDYLVFNNPQNEEEIKKKQLGKCIESYVEDIKIKEVAKRAVWLGNDETHYVRKWETKDIKDLTRLIDLTIYWIEAVELHKEFLENMPDNH